MTIENPGQCSHGGCPKLGTHRIVLILSNALGTVAKKFTMYGPDGKPARRCPQHQRPIVEDFIGDASWRALAERFARTSVQKVGYVAVPVRERTIVFFADDEVSIVDIPIMQSRGDGQFEEVGKTRVIS